MSATEHIVSLKIYCAQWLVRNLTRAQTIILIFDMVYTTKLTQYLLERETLSSLRIVWVFDLLL